MAREGAIYRRSPCPGPAKRREDELLAGPHPPAPQPAWLRSSLADEGRGRLHRLPCPRRPGPPRCSRGNRLSGWLIAGKNGPGGGSRRRGGRGPAQRSTSRRASLRSGELAPGTDWAVAMGGIAARARPIDPEDVVYATDPKRTGRPETARPARTPAGPQRPAWRARCCTAEPVRQRHGRDESPYDTTPPDCVAFPTIAEEVAEVVRMCARFHVPVIAYGAGTRSKGTSWPSRAASPSTCRR